MFEGETSIDVEEDNSIANPRNQGPCGTTWFRTVVNASRVQARRSNDRQEGHAPRLGRNRDRAYPALSTRTCRQGSPLMLPPSRFTSSGESGFWMGHAPPGRTWPVLSSNDPRVNQPHFRWSSGSICVPLSCPNFVVGAGVRGPRATAVDEGRGAHYSRHKIMSDDDGKTCLFHQLRVLMS